MKKILSVFLCLVFVSQALPQAKPAGAGAAGKPSGPVHLHVRVLAKAYDDSIVIRWAPANAVAWTMGKDSGYRIARIDYSDPQHPVSTLLSALPFRPLSHDQMMATLERNNKYAAIAAQALYGNDFRMTKDEPVGFAKKIKQGHDAMNFRYSFALQAADFSAPVASAIALRWVDKDVRKGGSYVYVVTVNGGNKSYVVDSAACFVVNTREHVKPVPEGLQAAGFDKQVELHWNRRQAGNFNAYYIERSDDEGKTFHTLNKLPFYMPDQVGSAAVSRGTGAASGSAGSGSAAAGKDSTVRKLASLLHDHQVYVDSIPEDYKRYYYRVTGVNAFAEQSPGSAVVMVEGRDLTPPAPPVIDSAKNPIGSCIDISWTQRKAAPDLAGYYISRGTNVKGPFTPITATMLPPGSRRFTDSAALPHLPNYYVIVAVDTAKNVAVSSAYAGYLTDTIPPAAPVALGGGIDSGGVVHLHWAANKESDLKGYKVYYGYGQKDQFSQVSSGRMTDTSFTDTISQRSLNRRIWYRVVAFDNSNNHSRYSAPVALNKIVVIPPSAPVAGAIVVDGRGVSMEWVESRSEGAVGYEVLRRTRGAALVAGSAAESGTGGSAASAADTGWHVIARLPQDWGRRSLLFADSGIADNTDYYFAARTIDSGGSRSVLSYPVHVRRNAVDTAVSPVGLSAALDGTRRHIRLSWKCKEEGDYFFVVYRSVNNGALTAWHSFEKGMLSGEDDRVASGTYSYAIKIVHRDREASSTISKPVQLLVQ
jgi:uncharacterized protein